MLANIDIFFNDHKETFEKLYLCFPCVDFLNELTFPNMKNLKSLYIREWCIYGNELDDNHAPFGVFNFGQQFPNLVTLNFDENPKLEGRCFFNLNQFFPVNTTPLLTLKNLQLPPITHPIMLRRLGRFFPNVIKLGLVPQTPEVLRELLLTWPKVKSLTISLVLDP